MRRADLLSAAVLALVGAVVVAEGWRLRIGWGTDGPEAGFFVFYLGVALVASAAVLLTSAVLDPDRPLYRKAFVGPGQLAPVATVLIPAILMVVLTQFLGLYVAGALYLAGYMRWVGRHSPALIALLAVGIPLATFLIFEVWFLVSMPKGPVEAYLGF